MSLFTWRELPRAGTIPLFVLMVILGYFVLPLFGLSSLARVHAATTYAIPSVFALPGETPAFGRLPMAEARRVANANPVAIVGIAAIPVVHVINSLIQAEEPVQTEARLRIPRIGVDARVKELGETSEGAMAVPDSRFDASWYNRGPRPGAVGSAVIGGHNWWNGGNGVFARLGELVPGDVVIFVDALGVSTEFVVREMRTYEPSDDATEIFDSKIGIHLNLITCSGVWDEDTQSFTKRLVIFSDVRMPPM